MLEVRSNRWRWVVSLSLLVLAAFGLYLLGNGRIALWDRDEPRYAMASRYMLQSGDWIVPHVGWGIDPQEWRTAKPVFIYWCQAAAMRVFGPTVFAARFPSSLAMALVVLAVGWGTLRLAGRRVALWTAGITATSAMSIAAAKMSVIDAVQLLWITIAQGCLLYIYLQSRKKQRVSVWVTGVMWACIALAGLSKGPVVLGVMGTTMLVLAVLDIQLAGRRSATALNESESPEGSIHRGRTGSFWRRLGRSIGWWLHIRPIHGLVIIAVIVGPPLVLLHERAPGFLRQQIFHDVIERTHTALEGHKGPPGFYLATIWGTFFPWCLFLPLALGAAWRDRRNPAVRFTLAAVIGPWVMMELVQTKLVHYILPVFPWLAYLVARALWQCFTGRRDDLVRKLAVFGAAIWSIAVLAMSFLPWLALSKFTGLPIMMMSIFSLAGACWAALVLVLFYCKKPRTAALSMGVGMFVLIAILCGGYLPRAEFLRLSPRLAAHLPVATDTQPGALRMIGYKEQSLAFYQGGTIDDAPVNFFAIHPPAQWPEYLVIQSDAWQKQPQSVHDAYRQYAVEVGLNYAGGGKVVQVLVLRRSVLP